MRHKMPIYYRGPVTDIKQVEATWDKSMIDFQDATKEVKYVNQACMHAWSHELVVPIFYMK
jgi:hypothetical protein